MTVRELIELLQSLPTNTLDMEVYFNDGEGGIQIEPLTISCDDPTIIGYVMTDETGDIH